MATVSLNYAPIETNGMDALETAIDKLNSAISYLQRNSVPGDFSRYNLFYSTLSDLKKQRDKLVYLKDWLKDSNKNYDSFIAKLETQANKLPSGVVKRRSKIVR